MPPSSCPFCGEIYSGDRLYPWHLGEHGFTAVYGSQFLCVCGFEIREPYSESLKSFREHLESLTDEEREEHLLMFQLGAVLTPVL